MKVEDEGTGDRRALHVLDLVSSELRITAIICS